MKKQKIEDIFSSMEDFSSVPPPELWGQIEEKLNKPKKKKRVILWWSAAACLLLGLMLPSVLHFTSNSKEINTIQNNTLENNSIVLDEKNNDTEKANENKGISKENNTINQSTNTNQITSSEETTNQSSRSLNQNQGTSGDQADSDNKTNNSSFAPKKNPNTILNPNNAAVEKSTVAAKENALNSVSKNPILNDKNAGSNQAVAEKSFNPAKENNTFNSASKNQLFNTKNGKSNQIAAEKSFISNKTNSFNMASKSQLVDVERKNADKALAEKTFTSGKQNKFNTASKNQLSNSIFQNSAASNSNNSIAYTLSPSLNGNQNTVISNKEKQNVQKTGTDRSIASVQKDNTRSNSSFTNVNILSKKDSAQLAELQNLEKGIIAPEEDKRKKEDKQLSQKEKWALQVFAGVANSENYRNNKTLGNVNDSKQSSSYGVKTQYKINKKWAVASGLKINELGQSVANVSYYNAKSSALFTPVDYFAQNASMPQQIASDANYVLVSNNAREAINSENVQTGNLDQNLRYLEMPLEVSYSIFNKNKANIYLNTGAFVGKLISNSVALDGNSIGENVNANDYVYGSTLSSTIQYRVYKKTNVFVEPAVNYYINPLSSQSFNQFQWGLNFGLNVNF